MRIGESMMRRVSRPALVLAVALAFSACATSGPEATRSLETKNETGFTITQKVRTSFQVRSDFETALGLLEKEDYDAGIALLEEVTEAAPLAATAHIDLGIAYGRVDDLERAEARFKRALELNPRHPVAHNELGIVYRRTGRFSEARESYLRALDVFPDFHFARRNLAILCDLYLGDFGCAIEHYELYAKAVPADEDTAMWIADLKNRLKE